METAKAAIRVEGLSKSYGSTLAVDEVSFEVGRGEIFGIVGPNGAGKTTTVECVTGMRKPDRGTIEVAGLNPNRQGTDLRRRIGIQLQQAALPERLKVREALDMYASFYDKPADWRAIMEQWGLADKQNTRFEDLSGGQQQRLFVALALLNDPEVVFLDEITTGLDPQARHASWDLIRGIHDAGKTVVLVTHFMDEAERLCDRVAIVDGGKIIALDTPEVLVRNLDAETTISFTVPEGFDTESLRGIQEIRAVEREEDRVVVRGSGSLLVRVVVALDRRGITPTDLNTESANLEDVFLALTGRTLRD